MTVKRIAKTKPVFPFEAYSHVVSPIDAADGGGFMFTMPDIPGVMGDGATELEAIADGREAFIATVSAMHMQLTARAKTEGVSLNALVLALIAEGLGRRNPA